MSDKKAQEEQGAKESAGKFAAELVENGMVIGLGTGSTSNFFIRELARRCKQENLRVTCIGSSYASVMLAQSLGIDVRPMECVAEVDLYADGADEVSPEGLLLKGRGAAMLREKILAVASRTFIVMIDETKLVDRLGTRFPIPIEVLPSAWGLVSRRIESMAGKVEVRQSAGKDGPVITDQGNFVLDAKFPSDTDFMALVAELDAIPGLIEHGVFAGLRPRIVVGTAAGAYEMSLAG